MFDNSDSAIEALKTVPFFSSLRREEANALVKPAPEAAGA